MSRAAQVLTRHPGRVAWGFALVLLIGGVAVVSSRPRGDSGAQPAADSRQTADVESAGGQSKPDTAAGQPVNTGVAANAPRPPGSEPEMSISGSGPEREATLPGSASPPQTLTEVGQTAASKFADGQISNPAVASRPEAGAGEPAGDRPIAGGRIDAAVVPVPQPPVADDSGAGKAELIPPVQPQPVQKTVEEYQAALAIPLLEFRQAEPVTVRQQLLDLEELVGVPIVLSDGLQQRPREWLDGSFAIALGECTVEQVMQRILDEAGLSGEFREGTLHLRAAGNLKPGSD